MAFEKPDKDFETKIRLRMSSKDVFYAGGIVNGSRSITLMGDAATRLMVFSDGNEGRCLGFDNIRLYNSIFSGDYLEIIARVIGVEGNKKKIQCRTFKVAYNPNIPEYPTAIDVLEKPILCTEFVATYESAK